MFQQNLYCSWIIRRCSFTTNSINTSSIFCTIYTFLKHSTINESLFFPNQIWKNKIYKEQQNQQFLFHQNYCSNCLFNKNPKMNLSKYSFAVKKNVLNHEWQLIFFHVFFFNDISQHFAPVLCTRNNTVVYHWLEVRL